MWFSDKASFGQQGTTTRIWAPRGSRPGVLRQTKYEWFYVIGAVCPQTGSSSGLLSPYINAEIMNIYLQQLSMEIAEDVHVVLIWDQAGFHKSKALKVPDNITIIALPALVSLHRT
ncbi:transposase [Planctomycetota bacterium]